MTYRIGDAELAAYATAVAAWNGTLTLDLNMRNGARADLAVAHAAAAARVVGWRALESFEIGK